MKNRTISYIPFGCMSQSGWIWFWSGCWVVRRRVTTSSVITVTTHRRPPMPRPPVPSCAPTTFLLSLASRKGIVIVLSIVLTITTVSGMARNTYYHMYVYECSYWHSVYYNTTVTPQPCPHTVQNHNSMHLLISTTPNRLALF